MREHVHILVLFGVIALLGGLLFLSARKTPVEKKPATEFLTDQEEKILAKAEIVLEKGTFAEADSLLTAIEKSKDLKLRLLRAEVQASMGKLSDSQFEEIEKEVVRDRGLERVYHLARIYHLRKNNSKALELFKDLLSLKISDALQKKVAEHFFEISLENQDGKASTDLFKRLCEKGSPPGTQAAQDLLKVLANDKFRKEYDEVSVLMERQYHQSCELLELMAEHRTSQGNPEEAARLYELCVKLNPKDERLLLAMYQTSRRNGNQEASFKTLEKLSAIEEPALAPASQSALLLQGAMDARQGNNLKKAWGFLRKATILEVKIVSQADEGAVQAIMDFADAKGNAEEKAFQKVFKSFLNGDFAAAEAGYGEAEKAVSSPDLKRDLLRLRNSCRTILTMDKAFQAEEDARRRKLEAQKKGQDKKPATDPKVKEKPATASPGTPLVNNEAASLKETIRTNSGNPDIVFDAGKKLFLLGELEEARKAFEAVIKLKPDHAEACFGLAQVLKVQEKPQEAVGLIEKAISLNPKESLYHSTFALILLDQGELERAGNEAKIAYYGNMKNAEAHLAMARWHAFNGDAEETMKYLESGLKAEESNPAVTRQLQELKTKMEQPAPDKTTGS